MISENMLTSEEERYILKRAYIPEHIVALMTLVSGGEPFLIGDCFSCLKSDWLILVGYPLGHAFSLNEFEVLIDDVIKRFRPKILSLMAPDLPLSHVNACSERQSDHYYTLDPERIKLRGGLRRAVNKARKILVVERASEMGDAHHELSLEFIKRVRPPSRVRELLYRMPKYVSQSKDATVLNARNQQGHLAAFYIVDLAAKDFSAYVIGCHSKKYYVTGASDLLCFEMIQMSREYGKKYIHLGLGVNDGLRRFKKKWGGIPTRKYEMCELVLKKPWIFDVFRMKQNF